MRMGMLSALQDRGGAAQDARPPHAQQQQQHHARRRPHEPRHYESRLARGGSHGELRTMAPLDRAVVEMVRPLPRSPPPLLALCFLLPSLEARLAGAASPKERNRYPLRLRTKCPVPCPGTNPLAPPAPALQVHFLSTERDAFDAAPAPRRLPPPPDRTRSAADPRGQGASQVDLNPKVDLNLLGDWPGIPSPGSSAGESPASAPAGSAGQPHDVFPPPLLEAGTAPALQWLQGGGPQGRRDRSMSLPCEPPALHTLRGKWVTSPKILADLPGSGRDLSPPENGSNSAAGPTPPARSPPGGAASAGGAPPLPLADAALAGTPGQRGAPPPALELPAGYGRGTRRGMGMEGGGTALELPARARVPATQPMAVPGGGRAGGARAPADSSPDDDDVSPLLSSSAPGRGAQWGSADAGAGAAGGGGPIKGRFSIKVASPLGEPSSIKVASPLGEPSSIKVASPLGEPSSIKVASPLGEPSALRQKIQVKEQGS
jgi:hypothetical protein